MLAILFMAIVMSVPMFYMGYSYVKKVMREKSTELTEINVRIAEMTLDKKAAILRNVLSDIEYSLSDTVELFLSNNIDAFENKMIRIYDDYFARDIDVFFFQSADGTYIFDASTPFYDTSMIKNYMIANNRFLRDGIRVIQSESADGTLIAITGSTESVSKVTGEFAGYLYTGVILNNATELINEIMDTTHLSEAALIYGDSIVIGHTNHSASDIIRNCYNPEPDTLSKNNIIQCSDLSIASGGITLKFYQSLPDSFLSNIKKQNIKVGILVITIMIIVTFLSGYLVNVLTVKTLYKLIDYTHLLLSGENAEYKQSMIYEFNALADQIKNVTCNLSETQAYMNKLIDSASAPIIIWDAYGNIILFNSAIEKLSGFESENVLGKHLSHIYNIFPNTNVSSTSDNNTENNYNSFESIIKNINTDQENYILWNMTDVYNEKNLSGTILQGVNITEIKKAEETMMLTSRVFENTLDGILLMDKDGKVTSCNEAFEKITGYMQEDILGKDAQMLRAHNTNAFYDIIREKIYKYGKWTGEVTLKKSDDSLFYAIVTVSAIRDQESSISDLIITIHDISERKSQEEHIKYQATHDALTGLPNRLYCIDMVAKAIDNFDGFHGMSVLFFDLDRFKNLNDSLGHATGDKILQIIAERLKSFKDDLTFVSKFSGDEFTVLFTELANKEEAAAKATRMLQRISEPITIQGYELFIQSSAGLCFFPENGKTASELIKNAEIAMYEAKAKGRNNLQHFSGGIESFMKDRLLMESKLNRALQNKEFTVYYQPKIDLATDSVMGMEALLRWNNPDLGFIPPDKFISITEENGLILPVGQWVMEQAIADTVKLHNDGFDKLKVAVNLSLRQFMQKDLVAKVKSALKESKIKDFCFEFEITESIFSEDLATITKIMEELNELGINFALDDFGTGYSSIGYLKKMPIKTLKIDRSYVSALGENADDESIVSSVILMSKSLGLSIVAEGVETLEQSDMLKEMGCNYVQGYYYGRPMPYEEFLTYLKSRAS